MNNKTVIVEPPRSRSPIENEYTRLLGKHRELEDRFYRLERNRAVYRIVLTLTATFMVYLAWACDWVNNKFLIAVSAVCIAVVAATLGSLWEKHFSRGGEE